MRWFGFMTLVFAIAGATYEVRAGDLRTYDNTRFGFTLQYPVAIFSDLKVSESGDGALFSSADGAKLLVGALPNSDQKSLQAYQAFVRNESYAEYEVDYQRRGETWFVLSGQGHGTTFYEKVFFSCGGSLITSFAMLYPTQERSKYDPIVEAIEDSFRPGAKGCAATRGAEQTEPYRKATTIPPSRKLSRSERRGPYAALADKIARARGRDVVVVLRRTGPPYNYMRVRGYASP
jgi:hypothetical protein